MGWVVAVVGILLVTVVVRDVFHTLFPSCRPWQYRAASDETGLAAAAVVAF
jgi:hypothetical protein